MRIALRSLLCIAGVWAATGVVAAYAADRPPAGERIYRQGVLPSGAPLRGQRQRIPDSEGAAAACVNCHRRSGLGSSEGTAVIPPITATYLFTRAGVPDAQSKLLAAAEGAGRAVYDENSLARAIRSGIGRGGRELKYVMPRYPMDDGAMAALIDYLKSLPTAPAPGVSATTVDFATIVTPDADPAARDGMLAVLHQFVDDKNAFIRGGIKPMQTRTQIGYRVTRRWQLHVWTLHGAASTWQAQLHQHLQAEPVMAVLSGIGGTDWSPIHRFCEAERVPCLFPNVDLPVDAEQDFYSLYFSKSVLLESGLAAAAIGRDSGGRVLQIYTDRVIGAAAAAALGASLPPGAVSLLRYEPSGDAAALARGLSDLRAGDTLVLWLGPHDLALLPSTPPRAKAIYVSGLLGGLENAPLPVAWRAAVELTYPVDLPQARAVRMNYPLRWFQIRGVPVTDERVQADTYLACGIVSEALDDLLENFMRDFLVERIESMLGHRQLSGYYPRLGLAPGQRFASKGGYLVRFLAPQGTAIEPVGDWIVP